MPIVQFDTENADRDLTSQVTVLTDTPDASNPVQCQAIVYLGDGAKDLDGTGGDFEMTITVGGQTVEPDPQTIAASTATRIAMVSEPFAVPANTEVIIKVKSPNAADTDVDVTAYLFDTLPINTSSGIVESNVKQVSDDATAAGYLEDIIEQSRGVALMDDAITSAKYDESTAYPLKSDDSGATEVARVGADGDTLEVLSDEIAALNDPTAAAIADAVWDEGSTGHTDAGKAGAQVWTDIDAILTDTD